MNPTLITTAQAMIMLKLSATSSVTRMVERGELTPIYAGRVLLFDRDDVERLAKQRAVKA